MGLDRGREIVAIFVTGHRVGPEERKDDNTKVTKERLLKEGIGINSLVWTGFETAEAGRAAGAGSVQADKGAA